MRITLHHVQVACPPGGEQVARRFYVDGLGLVEVAKPADLAGRGGAWFRAAGDGAADGTGDGTGGAEIHVGVEAAFVPARKAHPALLIGDAAALQATAARLAELGYEVDASQQDTFPGHRRLHTYDGHGNRVELLAT